jgi:hypothetical protein
MRTGSIVQAQIKRGANQPVARGASVMATANTRPITMKNAKFERGLNQMK